MSSACKSLGVVAGMKCLRHVHAIDKAPDLAYNEGRKAPQHRSKRRSRQERLKQSQAGNPPRDHGLRGFFCLDVTPPDKLSKTYSQKTLFACLHDSFCFFPIICGMSPRGVRFNIPPRR